MVSLPSSSFLGDILLFKGLSVRELGNVCALLKERSFRKGEMISTEGAKCERIAIVRAGRVKIFRTSESGREQILEVLEKGDTCACNPGVQDWQCSSSAQALSDCQVWFLNRSDYTFLVQSNHKLARQLNQIFAARICRFCSLIEEVSLKDSHRRIIKFILDYAQAESGNYEKTTVLSIPFSHAEIAQQLGLVRETVTRHLNRLKQDQLIDIQSHQIIVKDKKALQSSLL